MLHFLLSVTVVFLVGWPFESLGVDYRKDLPPPPPLEQWHVTGTDPKIYNYQHPHEFVQDEDIGLRHSPSSEIRHILRTDNELIYDALYRFDEFHRRRTPVEDIESRNRFLIFYGCSFTYGNGLDDDQTLPYFLAQKMPGHMPYNYAIGATGPNSMLGWLEGFEMEREVPQKNGIFVYVYMEAHITRANGFYPEIKWLKTTPYFEKNQQGRLERRGSFENGRFWTTQFYFLVGRLMGWMGKENHQFPQARRHHGLHTCQLIAQSRDTFEKKAPGNRFLVYFHPTSVFSPDSQQLLSCLQAKRVETLFQRVPRAEGEKYFYPHDGHPTGEANRIYAEELAKFLQ